MQNFQGTFETCVQSFIRAFSICMTVPFNPNLGGIFRGSFGGGGGGCKITPCLNLVRIMLEASNLARNYIPYVVSENIAFSA